MADVTDNVKHIADELSAGYDAEWVKTYKEEHDGEEPSAYDWLEDVLDIEYIVGGDGEYRGARVLVAFGGPNIWVDRMCRTCGLRLPIEDGLQKGWYCCDEYYCSQMCIDMSFPYQETFDDHYAEQGGDDGSDCYYTEWESECE